MLNTRIASAALVAALAFAGQVCAQAPVAATTQTSATEEFADGEIRKIDKDARKLTIRHGPLKSLDMPGMTMVFGVRDETVLDRVKVGEKVRFQVEKVDGKFVVTRIERAGE